MGSLDELLLTGLDGLVIATPSALHAEQSIRALEAGISVFCQKPLGRNADEVRAVVDAAHRADRLLAVDLSYRFTSGMQQIRELVRSGTLGRVFAADLVFHNAYGPDKAWFYDRRQAGGGCVINLGVHLVDLALWVLGFPPVERVTSRLFSGGDEIGGADDRVEDYAVAQLDLQGTVVRIACSWKLQAGRDAVIGATFYGTGSGAEFRNVDGSFYDFEAVRHHGTTSEKLVGPPDEWGGRAAANWAHRLAHGDRFDAAAEEMIEVARCLDSIYGR